VKPSLSSCVMGYYLFELGHTMAWAREDDHRTVYLDGYAVERAVPRVENIEVMFMASRIRHLSASQSILTRIWSMNVSSFHRN